MHPLGMCGTPAGCWRTSPVSGPRLSRRGRASFAGRGARTPGRRPLRAAAQVGAESSRPTIARHGARQGAQRQVVGDPGELPALARPGRGRSANTEPAPDPWAIGRRRTAHARPAGASGTSTGRASVRSRARSRRACRAPVRGRLAPRRPHAAGGDARRPLLRGPRPGATLPVRDANRVQSRTAPARTDAARGSGVFRHEPQHDHTLGAWADPLPQDGRLVHEGPSQRALRPSSSVRPKMTAPSPQPRL